MQLAAVKPNSLAVVKNGEIVLIDEVLAREGKLAGGASMIDLIGAYDSIRGAIEAAASKGQKLPLDPKRLRAPVERPSKIWAAASNYRRGSTGIESSAGRGAARQATPEEIIETTFLKPSSAIVGPEDNIVIPKNAETIFPELELCAVIGKQARNVSKADALAVVFGYTIILDVTARGYGANKSLVATRNVRKGFDSFAPIGPWITTRDEIPDPQNLTMRLWVNGELRQSASTSGMINGVADLVSYLSAVTTLYPGDLIATGNPDSPEFQQKLAPGDVLKAEIQGIGAMNLYVTRQ
ncbi:MAG TPA: fumarylacetoacetate hydrolase family protein [Candidatus Acidoferrales bacterium]|nr:fumarylacetoacetate hydrolase family protein [Candidatus Acidoferrales bacterium]